MRNFSAGGEMAHGVVAPVQPQECRGHELVGAREVGIDRQDTLETGDGVGGLAGVEQLAAERKMAQRIVRVVAGHLAELINSAAAAGVGLGHGRSPHCGGGGVALFVGLFHGAGTGAARDAGPGGISSAGAGFADNSAALPSGVSMLVPRSNR